MADAQKAQMASLKQRLEAETKDLKSCQTKKNMEDAKMIQTVCFENLVRLYGHWFRIRESRPRQNGIAG